MSSLHKESNLKAHPFSINAVTDIPKFIWNEIYLSYQFMRYDLTATIFPATLLLLAVAFAFSEPRQWFILLSQSIVYFGLYIYIFNLSNQYVGYEEDLINKPDRPLPMGMVTKAGTRVRWYSYSLIFMIFAMLFNVAEWALLWLLVVILHNWLYLSWHWLGKNILMGVGTFAQLAAAWQMVTPIDVTGWRWITIISIIIFVVVSIQDLRDIDGDKKVGRNTMPMVLGEEVSRLYFAVSIFITPFIIYFFLLSQIELSLFAIIHFAIMALMCSVMAIRLLRKRSTHDDRVTYDWLTTWYMVTLSITFWIL